MSFKKLLTGIVSAVLAFGGTGITAIAQDYDAEFHNTTVDAVTVDFPEVTKLLNGEPYSGNEFSFSIEETDGPEWNTREVTDGVVAIPESAMNLTFSEEGYREFTVSEDTGNNPIYTYDNTLFKVGITVTLKTHPDTGVKYLDSSVEITRQDGTSGGPTDNITFNNSSYTPLTVNDFQISKILDDNAYTGEDFSFRITPRQATAGITFVDVNGNERAIGERLGIASTYKNVVDGDLDFEYNSLTFYNPGEVVFNVYEINSGYSTQKPYNYDGTIYTVRIGAIASSATTLESYIEILDSETGVYDQIQFANTVAHADPIDIDFSVKKNALHNYSGDGFDFILEGLDSQTEEYVQVDIVEDVAPGAGATHFSPVTISSAGEYFYRISELVDETQKTIVFDGKVQYYRVVVEEKAIGGKPVFVPTIYEGNSGTSGIIYNSNGSATANTVAFTNKYVEPVEYNLDDLGAIVNLNGEKYSGTNFSFVAAPTEGSSITSAATISNGAIKFPTKVSFSAPGDYKYTIKQTDKGNVKTYYDMSEYEVTFHVTRDMKDANLEVAVSSIKKGDSIVDAIVYNNYTYDPTELALIVDKLFQSEAYKSGKAFTFELLDSNKEVIETKSLTNDEGKVVFSAQDFDKAGTYIFYMRETKGLDEAISYDTTLFKAEVTVANPTNPATDKQLVIKSVVYKVVTDAGEAAIKTALPTFSNKIVPASVKVFGKKLYNATVYTGTEYTFQLKDTTEQKKVIAEQNTVTNGIFLLDTLEFTAPGEYKYTVNEKIPTDSSAITKTVYDERVYNLVITVTREGVEDWHNAKVPGESADAQKKLVATMVVTEKTSSGDKEAKDGILFENDPRPISTSYQFSAKKTLNGKAYNGNLFTYELYDNDGKKIQTNNISTNGVINFGAIRYDKVGRYTYKAKEVKGTDSNYKYDEREYTIVVEVTLDRTTNKLSAKGTITVNNQTASAVEFANFSTGLAPTPTPTPGGSGSNTKPKTGDSLFGIATGGICAAAALGLVVILTKKRKEEDEEA